MEYENGDGYTQSDFLKYGDMFALRDNSYYYDSMKDPENYLNSIHEIYKQNISWRNFEYLLLEKKIKVVKKPDDSTFGWFWGKKSTINDDLLYTFDRYKEILDKKIGRQNVSQQERAQDNLRIHEQNQNRERQRNLSDRNEPIIRRDPSLTQKRVHFKNNYPKIIEIFKDFVVENDQQLNNLLDHVLEEQNLPEPEAYDILIEEARRKYNFEKEKYNENVRNFSQLSTGMKEKTKEMGKNIDKFLLKLKPIIKDFNARNKARDESLKSKVLKQEKNKFDLMLEEEEKRAKQNNEKLKLERENNEKLELEKQKQAKLKLDEERKKQEDANRVVPEKSTPFLPENNSKKIKRSFIQKYPKIIEIYEKFIMDRIDLNNNFLEDVLIKRNLPEKEAYNFLLQDARQRYNFRHQQFLEKTKNSNFLSFSMKTEEKILDDFYNALKPLLKDLPEFQMKQAEEEIKELNSKIIDASGRYVLNKGKIRAAEFKLQKLEKLEKRKNELTEKLRLKNLSIEERQQILKEKTDLNEKLANIEKVKDQLVDLKSKIPNPKVFELEKEFREYELNKYRKMNDASIRQKNNLLKSIELEKMKQEIAIREEQRYQEEQRQKEELKQAKIVFLKEKKITERKLNQLNTENRMKISRIVELKKVEQDLFTQKKYFEKIKAEKQSALHEKKLQIEQAKLKTLELREKKLKQKQDFAEQQKLFSDSIQRDIDDLNDQKNVLKNLTTENKKILENTKREISARQNEIEKNIKLNLETVKEKELIIFSEEAKIKLDVFTTLSDVKEQTAIKLDVENMLADLKDEIIRKQDVTELLSDAVQKISNNEIDEIENYNAFLEKEIEFKQKLTDKNLSLANYKEIVAEEKEDLIERLEKVKSQKLKKIYQLREEAIEQQMKIILIEGAEDLKSNLFSLNYEIENLEKEKEISERKEDLAKFQSDNFKRELKLRKQEIELLKNIRLKVLETERKTIRTEAQKTITDIVKSIEKDERDSDVREKLDEILDDVETKEISAKSKATLFSLIDKIEKKEIHDAAKEKLNFILGKIELHDNIDESKKTLDQILDKIEDTQIRQDVEEKLNEILDDVEYDDYDFLDENDDLDTFLSNVKKHISGEKKWNNFQK